MPPIASCRAHERHASERLSCSQIEDKRYCRGPAVHLWQSPNNVRHENGGAFSQQPQFSAGGDCFPVKDAKEIVTCIVVLLMKRKTELALRQRLLQVPIILFCLLDIVTDICRCFGRKNKGARTMSRSISFLFGE